MVHIQKVIDVLGSFEMFWVNKFCSHGHHLLWSSLKLMGAHSAYNAVCLDKAIPMLTLHLVPSSSWWAHVFLFLLFSNKSKEVMLNWCKWKLRACKTLITEECFICLFSHSIFFHSIYCLLLAMNVHISTFSTYAPLCSKVLFLVMWCMYASGYGWPLL